MRFADLDARFFQGVIPSAVATCSLALEPNVTYASQVFRIDGQRVALSCQFFNKTKQNLQENPYATLTLYDPLLFDCYRITLRYQHSEDSGALFEQMSARIQAIASHTGMQGIFKLQAADVFDVLTCEKLDAFTTPSDASELAADALDHRNELRALQLVSRCLNGAGDIESVLQQVLVTLEEALGFGHSMVFVLDTSGERLKLIARHGYDGVQVGTTLGVGEGLIGTVAQQRRHLRLSHIETDLRYGRAVRHATHKAIGPAALQSEVPLPGLFDAVSQMAMPLLLGERLLGVIAVESPRVLAFDEWDETFLEIVASQIAARLDSQTPRLSTSPPTESALTSSTVGHPREAVLPAMAREEVRATLPFAPDLPSVGEILRFRFFTTDDCVFLGEEYLVRNVPGRILWSLLRAYAETGRADFSNRELRLDPWLKLPPIRDNLESRLTLLRKRLQERCPQLRLVSTARGCFRIESGLPLTLEEVTLAAPDG